jgi:hypothetical protein
VTTEPTIVVAQPHTFGWLRRSERDRIAGSCYFEAWERPDGGIVRIPRQKHDEQIKMIVAVRRRDSVFVVLPTGTAQAASPSRFPLAARWPRPAVRHRPAN